jgi:sugar transferase (PEP-CTERM system associated)
VNYYLRHPYGKIVAAAIGLDFLAFVAAASLVWIFARPPATGTVFALVSGLGALLCCAALASGEGYAPSTLSSWRQNVRVVLRTMGVAFAVALFLFAAVRTTPEQTQTLASVALLYFPLLLAGRFVFRSVTSMRDAPDRILVIGASDLGVAIADYVRSRPHPGIELLGFLSDDFLPQGIAGFPVLGAVHQLEKMLDMDDVNTVVVASFPFEDTIPSDELLRAKMRGVRVESGLCFYERLTGRLYLREVNPSHLIFSEGFRTSRTAEIARRGLDIAMALVSLLLVSPVLAACALAIRLDSKGPVFYRQVRIGKDGRPFRVMKLRTMKVDAEKGSGARFAMQRDPRVTRVGRFLRMTRLDEVPQYWNVLTGDMSIVGPRPERPEFMDTLASRYPLFRLRLAQKPGLTGWAQVRYGYASDIEEFETKLGLDLYYLKHRSLFFDVLIILQTVKTVLLFRGI